MAVEIAPRRRTRQPVDASFVVQANNKIICKNVSIVDTEEKLRGFMPVLDQMVQQGLVVLSDVDVINYTHNYEKSERRQESRA